MSRRVAIGIDLGTTYSCVGVCKDEKVDIIINDMGSRITPSCVGYNDQEELVGEAAKRQALVNSKNTVFETKRLIGRRFKEASVQEDKKHWPFEVIDVKGAPKIKVQHKHQEKILTPEQVSAAVLSKMREMAQQFVGEVVEDAVITVPAYFNDSQRQATMDAGKIAGLNVLQILNEPTAAAIAYGVEKNISRKQTVLVFDLGGGTLDVVILSIDNKTFQVKAVGGDTHLGGSDFDSKILEYFLDLAKREYNEDLSTIPKALGRLRKSCIEAKIALSSAEKGYINIDCFFNGQDFITSITRVKFEELCKDLFAKTIEIVKSVLSDSGLKKSEIDEVVLVGGSSRIPKIQTLLKDFFDGKELNRSVNPDEAVAYGAAVCANSLVSGSDSVHEVTLQDVIPLSLGMAGVGDVMNVFIERNTRIPTSVRKDSWTTSVDNQEGVTVSIYEGENPVASKNHLLGRFELLHDERAKAGVPKLAFTFALDSNGILHVSGENTRTNQKKNVKIISAKGRLTPQEVDSMKQENNNSLKEKTKAYCLRQKQALDNPALDSIISQTQRMSVLHVCNEAIHWLNKKDTLDDAECRRKLFDVQLKCNKILPKIKPIGLVRQGE